MIFHHDMDADNNAGDIRRIIRRTLRRRLMLLGTIVIILCGSAAGLYAYHHAQAAKVESHVKLEGIAAANRGDFAQAVSLLTQYLQSHGDDAEALAAYARVRLASAPAGDRMAAEDTISALQQLLDLQNDDDVNLDETKNQERHRLLELCLNFDHPTQAVDAAGQILNRSAGDVPALAGKANALMQLGEWDRALDAARHWAAAVPFDLHAQTTVFDLMQRAGKPADAIAARAMALRQKHPQTAAFALLESYALTQAGLSAEPAELAPDKSDDVSGDGSTVDNSGPRRTAADLALSAASAPPPKGDEGEHFVALLTRQLDELGLSDRALDVLQTQAAQAPTLFNRRALVRRLWEMQQWPAVIAATGDVIATSTAEASGKEQNPIQDDPELLALRGVAIFHCGDKDGTKETSPLLAPIRAALAQQAADAAGAAWQAFFDQAISPSAANAAILITRCQDPAAQNLASPCLRYVLAIAMAQLNERDLAIQQLQTIASQNVFWEAPAADEAELLLEQGRVDQALQTARLAEQRLALRGQSLDQRLAIILARVWLEAIERGQMQTPGSAADLQRLVDAVQQTTRGEPFTLAVQVALHLRAKETDAARESFQRALQSLQPISEQTLEHLVQLSRAGNLNMQQACFDRWQKDHGLTAELVLTEALDARQAALAAQATTSPSSAATKPSVCQAMIDGAPAPTDLKTSPQPDNESAAVQWQVARARYLDIAGEARASAVWSRLGDGHADDLHIQQLILERSQNAGHTITEDRALTDRTINRVRALTGDGCLQWRLSRGHWWIEDASAGSEQIEEGCRLLSAVLQTCPDCLDAYRLMARGLRRLNNFDGAIQQLKTARNIDPSSPETVLELVDLLESQRRMSEAWLVLRPLTQGANPNPAALLATGWLQEHDGDLPAAADSYRRVLVIVPDSVAAENNLAMVLAKNPNVDIASEQSSADLRQAMNLALHAVTKHPDSPDLYDTLAFVQNKCSDTAGALRSIGRAIALAPEDARWRLRRAEILCAANRRDEARGDVEAAQKALSGDSNGLSSGGNEMMLNELHSRLDALRVQLISTAAGD